MQCSWIRQDSPSPGPPGFHGSAPPGPPPHGPPRPNSAGSTGSGGSASKKVREDELEPPKKKSFWHSLMCLPNRRGGNTYEKIRNNRKIGGGNLRKSKRMKSNAAKPEPECSYAALDFAPPLPPANNPEGYMKKP